MDQFMDQVKSFVRIMVTYRFWIAITVAAMFSGIAYFLGSGPVHEKTKSATASIEKADKDVKQFASPGLPNDQFKPLIDEKTDVLTKDVNSAWRVLYNRQAPLLTWPRTVQDTLPKWGRTWPENVAKDRVTIAIVNYARAYPEYIDSLYKICKPFDLEKRVEGVVLAPPKESLLRPAVFDINKPADLGKVWATQERHWTQRTLLEVIAAVNKNAQNWDQAIIKQILEMEVGNPEAQDQRSIASEEELTESEAIYAPGEEEEEEVDTMSSGRGRRGDEDFVSSSMGGSGAADTVFYIDKTQYKIMPVYLAVLIDQEKISNLLVELENSPMAVQVMDYEMARPTERVVKPNLAEGIYNGFSNYGMMRGGRGRRDMDEGGMFGAESGYSGMGGRMRNMVGFGGRGARMDRDFGGGGFGGGLQSPAAKNLRGTDPQKKREEIEKAMENARGGPSLFDPYYNIVEVKIYGQARFYNAPPSEEEASEEQSLGTDANAEEASPATPANPNAAGIAPANQ
jgi:hypothetical protein